MRYLILFCAFFLNATPVQAEDMKAEPPPVRALLEFCLSPLYRGDIPADAATLAKLPEFSPEQAIKFAPDGGRVFAIPYGPGNLALTTSKTYSGVCSIAVREARVSELWHAIDRWFGPQTPFKLLREKRLDQERVTRREYEGMIGKDIIGFLVSVSDVPRKDAMQALMTVARIKKEKPAR